MEFGKTLRAAREARGKTIDEVARETRLMSQLILDLENENMSRIAAPIYGRGFVKLYCEAVGLEAKPMIDEFMKVYNGDHEPIIRERDMTESTAQDTESLLNDVNKEPIDSPLFDTQSEPLVDDLKPHSLSRYSTPISERGPAIPSFSLPPIVWRIGAIAIVAILTIWVLCKAIGAIYRFSATDPNAAQTNAENTIPAQHIGQPVERELVPIPPLYID